MSTPDAPSASAEEVLRLAQALVDEPNRFPSRFNIDGAFYLQFFHNRFRSSLYELRRSLNGGDQPRPKVGSPSGAYGPPPPLGVTETIAVLLALEGFATSKRGQVTGLSELDTRTRDLARLLVSYFARPGEQPGECLNRLDSAWVTAQDLANEIGITEAAWILESAIWGEPCPFSDFSFTRVRSH